MNPGFKNLKNHQAFMQFAGTANFFYATSCDFGVHLIFKGRNYLFVSFMDYELAKERFSGKIIRVKKKSEVFEWLRKKGVKEIVLPYETSYGRAKEIEKLGFRVSFFTNPFSKKREIKTAKELKAIKESCNAVLKTFKYALRILQKGKSCAELKQKLEKYLYTHGYVCEELIVSSGKLSAIPHASGRGKIKEHVVIDIFPYSKRTRYHSDFTRTVLLEKNTELEEMLLACIEAKNRGIAKIRHGVKASSIYHEICDVLEEKGFDTLRRGSGEGFIHAAGHGVGLEIHEAPSLSEDSKEIIKKGMVITVEPGLYYKHIGGVRVEDTVLVRRNGAEVLTRFKDFLRKY